MLAFVQPVSVPAVYQNPLVLPRTSVLYPLVETRGCPLLGTGVLWLRETNVPLIASCELRALMSGATIEVAHVIVVDRDERHACIGMCIAFFRGWRRDINGTSLRSWGVRALSKSGVLLGLSVTNVALVSACALRALAYGDAIGIAHAFVWQLTLLCPSVPS